MILVLEDDRSIRETLGTVLEHLGIEHKLASTCDEAIAIMKTHAPVTLLADMMLADGDARSAIKFCKENHGKCKTVLFTAMNKKKAEETVQELHMDCMLLKPFQLEELIQLLI